MGGEGASNNCSPHYQCLKPMDEVITKDEELRIFNSYFRWLCSGQRIKTKNQVYCNSNVHLHGGQVFFICVFTPQGHITYIRRTRGPSLLTSVLESIVKNHRRIKAEI